VGRSQRSGVSLALPRPRGPIGRPAAHGHLAIGRSLLGELPVGLGEGPALVETEPEGKEIVGSEAHRRIELDEQAHEGRGVVEAAGPGRGPDGLGKEPLAVVVCELLAVRCEELGNLTEQPQRRAGIHDGRGGSCDLPRLAALSAPRPCGLGGGTLHRERAEVGREEEGGHPRVRRVEGAEDAPRVPRLTEGEMSGRQVPRVHLRRRDPLQEGRGLLRRTRPEGARPRQPHRWWGELDRGEETSFGFVVAEPRRAFGSVGPPRRERGERSAVTG
jgi:hypothetical protein